MAILRVKASSIIEVSVAMVITSIALSCSLMLFQRISTSSYSLQELKAQQLLTTRIEHTLRTSNLTNFTETTDQLTIEQKTHAYPPQQNLMIIHLTAYRQDGKQVAELKRIVYAAEN